MSSSALRRTQVRLVSLPGFFDLNLLPIDVAALLVLLWTPGSHLWLLERASLLRGIVQKAILAAQIELPISRAETS
jgi:hypothetical protein